MLDILAYRRKKNKDKFDATLNNLIRNARWNGAYKTSYNRTVESILIDNDKDLINMLINKLKIRIAVKFKVKMLVEYEKDDSESNDKFKLIYMSERFDNTLIINVENIYYEPDDENKKRFAMYIDKTFFKVNYGLQSNKVIEPKASVDTMRNLLNKKTRKRNNTFSKSNIRRVPKV